MISSRNKIGVRWSNNWGGGSIIQTAETLHTQTHRQDKTWHFNRILCHLAGSAMGGEGKCWDEKAAEARYLRKLLVWMSLKNLKQKKWYTITLTSLEAGWKSLRQRPGVGYGNDPKDDLICLTLWEQCWESMICSKTDGNVWELERKGCSLKYEKLQK